MVRFHSNSRSSETDDLRRAVPNYFSRPQQYRLLLLTFTLLLVLFMMSEAAKPKNWQWMWHLADAGVPLAANAGAANAGRVDEIIAEARAANNIDTRLDFAERTSHPPGVFVATSNAPNAVRSGNGHNDDPTDGLFPGVTTEQLATIRDDTVFRSDEADAWFSWCALLRAAAEVPLDSPGQLLDDSAHRAWTDTGEVTFLQLFRQPDAYRGRLVRVSGVVRRAHRVTARENSIGVEDYVRCWLFPESDNPIVVYALHMPDDFPTGLELHENVTFTGLFFKRWAYQSKGGIMTAPLVLAARADWKPQPPASPIEMPSLTLIVAAVVLAVAVGGSVCWFGYQQSNSRKPSRRIEQASAVFDGSLIRSVSVATEHVSGDTEG